MTLTTKPGLVLLALLASAATASAAPRHDPICIEPIVTPATAPCAANAKSEIRGDTLFIDGRIDGMTYDLMSVGNAGTGVTHVELNSYGGDEDMGEQLAALIRARGMSTHVRQGAFCASTCVLLLQAGVDRSADPSARFGIHGVRVGGDLYFKLFYDACGDNGSQERCNAFAKQWHDEALEATKSFFALMTGYGAAASLLDDYLAQGEEKDWYKRGNGLRTRDWLIDTTTARRYGLIN